MYDGSAHIIANLPHTRQNQCMDFLVYRGRIRIAALADNLELSVSGGAGY